MHWCLYVLVEGGLEHTRGGGDGDDTDDSSEESSIRHGDVEHDDAATATASMVEDGASVGGGTPGDGAWEDDFDDAVSIVQ